MATITTKPYGQFLLDLGTGSVHNLPADQHNVALITSSYTPDYTNDTLYSDVSGFEMAASEEYSSGGTNLVDSTWTYNPTSGLAVLTASPMSFTALTGTFRYACIYRFSNVATKPLIGLVDFGEDRTYNEEPLQLSFSNGLVVLGG